MDQPPRSFTASFDGRTNILITPVYISPAFDPIHGIPLIHKQYNGLWDTGATNTCITKKIIDELELKPVGMTLVKHADGESMSNTFLVNIGLLNKVGFSQIRVTEGKLSGLDLLIGMDIITRGDFAITHMDGKSVFSFRCPSVACIDFVKESDIPVSTIIAHNKPTRNGPCPCGSKKKYKYCCGKAK